jgi:site-specific DNA recombinase
MGWAVAGEYVDNDLSAYSGKHRPEYERMLADLQHGVLDGVLVYNIDRLSRRPAELERFYEVAQAARVKHVKFATGDTDISTADGLMMARVLGAFAAKESANIARRVTRKMEQVAAEGRPHGGSVRPFGYADDKITVVEDQAAAYRTVVARFLAGDSLRSLATWLNDEQVATVTGKPWRTTTLKGILTNPRYAGLRAHRGVVVGPAVWKAIITEVEHRRVLAKFAEQKNSGRRVPQTYLLSGMLRCGKCETKLYSSRRENSRRYVCLSGPDHGGCGRLTVVAEPVELLVANAVLYRLDTPELADTIAGRSSADERIHTLTRALDQAQEHLEELSSAYGTGQVSMREWMTAKKPIVQRLEQVQRQLGRLTHTSALAGMIGNGQHLRGSWDTLNLSRQNAIVAALVDHVTIGPGTPGVHSLDPSRVKVVWRH